jgi:hypothetical protein
MPISILHVGLPLDHPAIPAEERPKIAKRLTDLRQVMRGAGYNYEIAFLSPESGLEDFKNRLTAHPCHGVLIGGGIASDPAMIYFLEQIVNATHDVAPNARIMFYDHSVDVRITVERWFPSPSG